MNIEQLKFPIGDYIAPEKYTLEILEKWISDIDSFPKSMEELCGSLTVEQLNWRYRPDGWKIKQVVHHCSDSHINQLYDLILKTGGQNLVILLQMIFQILYCC